MQHNSGFDWDHVTEKFTAHEHIWEDYFRVNMLEQDLRIVVGCGTVIVTSLVAIGDGVEETTFETEERMKNINFMDDIMFDPDCEVFVNTNNTLDHMSLSPMHYPPFVQHKSSEKLPSVGMRNRTNFEANPKSIAFEPNNLTESVNRLFLLWTKEYNCWGI
ncbi:50S ribosomal protein L23 [Striga asiatica]|uniref:50S ribosomal protein L23 n=1 Tax=Striga asiatica TaxID=4170 RepID=A0A5A7RIP7_STRAF|nr:50S ribosomal protein L23 [Striga asiatica]